MEGKSRVNTSSELLEVTGDGTSRSVVENLLRQPVRPPPADRPKTFKVARSPLLDQLQTFLPQFQQSNEELLSRPQQQLDNLNIENTEKDDKVVEMNVLLGKRKSDDEGNDDSDEGGAGVQNLYEDSSESDSEGDDDDDELMQGNNVTLNVSGNNTQHRNLIQVLSESVEDEEAERSDGEVTVSSSASGER